jgi:hypothetical protein
MLLYQVEKLLPEEYVIKLVLVSILTWTGLNSKVVGREEEVSSGLSNKAASSSVLLTSRTEGEVLRSNNLKCFTINEVKTATRYFCQENMVGERRFGCVFKGWIDEHTLAATKQGTGFSVSVKRLKQESNQLGHNEWLVSVI